VTFKIHRDRTFPDIAGHESVKGWTGMYFYCKDLPKAGKEVGWPAFVDRAAEPHPSWSEVAPHPISPELHRLIRQIEKLIQDGLTGLDLVICWLARRIQPLQHHDRLLHEYTEDVDDDLRVCKVNLPASILDTRLKKLTKLKTNESKEYGWNPTLEMYTKGSCPPVRSAFCFFQLYLDGR
jgi:hypothetical protein